MKKLLCLIFTLALSFTIAYAGNVYDKYGSKTGSYRTSGSRTVTYDKYGSKTGTYKTSGSQVVKYDKYGSKQATIRKTSLGYNTYDKYGSKTGSYRESSNGAMTNMGGKSVVSEPLHQERPFNMIVTDEKSEVLNKK